MKIKFRTGLTCSTYCTFGSDEPNYVPAYTNSRVTSICDGNYQCSAPSEVYSKLSHNTERFKKYGCFLLSEHSELLLFPSVADADPGSGVFLTPGSGMGKIQIWDPGWTPQILFLRTSLKILKVFYSDPDPVSCQPWIRDGKNLIRNKLPGSATLLFLILKLKTPTHPHRISITHSITHVRMWFRPPCSGKKRTSTALPKAFLNTGTGNGTTSTDPAIFFNTKTNVINVHLHVNAPAILVFMSRRIW
jgi:hypothetical protein